MNDARTLLIRADAGGLLGTGHIMRMIALAQAWQDSGGDVHLAACQCPDALVERIKQENIAVHCWNDTQMGGAEDAERTMHLLNRTQSKWLVLDGYHFTESYHQAIGSICAKVLAVDDWGHCDRWDVDLLLNQNFHAEDQYLKKPHGLHTSSLMAGPKFALLRREFRHLPARFVSDMAKPRLLVTFGGVDPDDATGTVLSCLERAGLNWNVTALIGTGNPNRTKIEDMCAQLPNTSVLHAVIDMPSLYASHDGVISAAGSSCYEWLRFGLPALVYAIADNQVPLLPYLNEIDGVEAPGWLSEASAIHIQQALERLHGRIGSHRRQTSIIDGLGAQRVVKTLLAS